MVEFVKIKRLRWGVVALRLVGGLLLALMLDDIRFSNEATAKAREAYLSIPNFVARLPIDRVSIR